MKMRIRAIIFQLMVLAVWSASGIAQKAAAGPPDPARISISVFVTDTNGNAANISKDDLSIEDQHQPPRKVIAVKHNTSPVWLGVLIDKSNSQRESDVFEAGLRNTKSFLKQVLQRDGDKAFIEAFETFPYPPTQWLSSNDIGRLKLDLRPTGATSLFDAIDYVCKQRLSDRTSPARRVLVLLSDGDDTQSRTKIDAAIAEVQRAKAVIIAISTHEKANVFQGRGNDGVLKRLADESGGYAYVDLRAKDMQNVFSEIALRIDSMFEVVYVPEGPVISGEAHQFQIKPVGKSLNVHAPKLYYPSVP